MRFWQISALILLGAGVVSANGIVGCSLNGNSLNLTQCYSPNTFFQNPLTVDWGTAFGTADITPGVDPHSVNTLGPWTTSIAGVSVGVNVGGDFSSGTGGAPQLSRLDNEVYVWDPSQNSWTIPQFTDPNLQTYGGHFGAPGPAEEPGSGDHLLDMYNGKGSFVINFSQGMTDVGLLVSVMGAQTNSNFDATIRAYDQNSNLIATYVINTQGVGGECAGLFNFAVNPQPCNDAPFIGVRSPLNTQQIYSIVITATTAGSMDSLLLDSLEFQESPNAAPEPAVLVLSGAGLVLFGLLRRRRVH